LLCRWYHLQGGVYQPAIHAIQRVAVNKKALPKKFRGGAQK
jgi:hypothetical protein